MKSAFALRLATLAAAALPLTAFADAPFHASNDEAGTVYHVLPSRADTPRSRPTPDDPNWEDKGGDSGWELRQHAYEFRGGKVIHADGFDHESPRKRVDAADPWRRNVDHGGA